MNFKNGGTNHRIHGMKIKANTMIIGADVTHPGMGALDTYPSIAGIVASYDAEYVHYLASARLQGRGIEVRLLPNSRITRLH